MPGLLEEADTDGGIDEALVGENVGSSVGLTDSVGDVVPEKDAD